MKNGIILYVEREVPVYIGYRTIGRSFLDDISANNRFSLIINNPSGDLFLLLLNDQFGNGFIDFFLSGFCFVLINNDLIV
ncbi:hypothetical protein SDC9_190883 [bioreactor metagenome]|uniref:Uncharacterized protein n=1 Tax=bioreactor metagenome TaxID=1076179 RepID=A0A645I4H8_9ZZZZ